MTTKHHTLQICLAEIISKHTFQTSDIFVCLFLFQLAIFVPLTAQHTQQKQMTYMS